MANLNTSPTDEKSTTVRIRRFRLPAPIRWAGRSLAAVSPNLATAAATRLFLGTTRRRPPARELRWLRFGRERTFELQNGGKVAGTEWGDGDALVLLVHGWGGRGTQLGSFVAPLVDRGYRVVAIDAVGHGETEGDRSTIVAFADSIHAVTRELGPIHALVAHSFGCAAATVAADRGTPIGGMLFLAPPSDLRLYLENLIEALGMPAAIVRKVQERLGKLVDRTWQSIEPLNLAPALRIPMMTIHDEGDRDAPLELGRRLVDAWPGARLVTTTGLGHRRILRDPDVIREGLRFIDVRPTGFEGQPRSSRTSYSSSESGASQIEETPRAVALRLSAGMAV